MLGVLLPLVLLCPIGVAKALDPLQYGAFTQTATYSIANQLGFFTSYGLDVTYHQVPNSTYAYAQILNGAFDILTGTIDNSVNLRFNLNESLTVLGQLDQGPDIVFASTANISSFEQLRGNPLIVDNPVSGFAYILRKILALNGLTLENGDSFFQVAGSTDLRYADLVSGRLPNGSAVYGTILTYPFTAESQAQPPGQKPNILARLSDYIAPISSSAFTARESALGNATEAALLTRFLAAMYTANRYLHTPVNRPCVVEAIAAQLNVSDAVADTEYEAATSAVSGEVSPDEGFSVDRVGLLSVIDVRGQFGGFSSLPPDFNFTDAITPGMGKLIDYTLRDAAVKMLNETLLSASC